jgi:hypothetical protein
MVRSQGIRLFVEHPRRAALHDCLEAVTRTLQTFYVGHALGILALLVIGADMHWRIRTYFRVLNRST